jgi:hypothetical protein
MQGVKLRLGFPESGGVWVLDISQSWNSYSPRIMVGWQSTLAADERCDVLEGLAANFCESMLCKRVRRRSLRSWKYRTVYLSSVTL